MTTPRPVTDATCQCTAYYVVNIDQCALCGKKKTRTVTRPVTGPDGDNPITDEQIRELRDIPENVSRKQAGHRLHLIAIALGERQPIVGETRAQVRTRLAAAYNARSGKEGR